MNPVLIADPHQLVLCGLRRLLEDAGFDVVGEATDGEEAVRIAIDQQPEIVLLDSGMPGIGSIEVTSKLRRGCPDCRIIVLTAEVDGPVPRALLKTGVDAFLSKQCTIDHILDAINRVRSGKRYISHDLAEGLALANAEGRFNSPFDLLTQRELQVITMIVDGHPHARIAESLRISPKTVTTYRYRVMRKIGARTTSDLLRMAMQYHVGAHNHLPLN